MFSFFWVTVYIADRKTWRHCQSLQPSRHVAQTLIKRFNHVHLTHMHIHLFSRLYCIKAKVKVKFLCTSYWALGPELIPVYRQSTCRWLFSNVKFFRTCYWALGPELIPVYGQSVCRWFFKSSPGGRLALLSTRPAVTFQVEERYFFQPVTSYDAWWQKHVGVNNLPKVVTQSYPGGNWTHDHINRKY